MTDVHVVVPEGIDDPGRPSGGNLYDRRVIDGLSALGWSVHEHAAPGAWPAPSPDDHAALEKVLAGVPDGALVMVDGLVASAAPEELVPRSRRLRLVVLVHLPLTEAPPDGTVARTGQREHAVLSAAAAVVTTSAWTRRRLLDRHRLRPDRVHVAEPGVDPADPAPGTATGGELLCVAAVAPHKGQDVLVSALATLRDRPWACTLVGSLDRDAEFVEKLRRRAEELGIADRLRLTGPLAGAALDSARAAADLLVLPSRAETYGMVVTEALAHGLPVVASDVGGLPETLSGIDERPGFLVPPGDAAALAAALDAWLAEPDLRRRWRRAALLRRSTLRGWPVTAERVGRVLAGLA